MPNEIYLRTHDGLSAMVSSRAASRVLDGALRALGVSAETITAEQMSKLLHGSIRRELEGILPPDGLRRNLEDLTTVLRDLTPAAARPRGAQGKRASVRAAFEIEDDAVPSDLIRDSGEVEPDALREVYPTAEDAPAASAAPFELEEDESDELVAPHGTVTSERLRAAAAAPQAQQAPAGVAVAEPEDDLDAAHLGGLLATDDTRVHELAELERGVLAFAQLEHVRLVAALREDGSVAVSRGTGIDLDDLSRLGVMGLKLLQRSGQLRSFYLGHTNGQLFLFPFGRDVLAVVGGPDLNLGGVFAALVALKEEL